jgi:hypothetical protein
MSQVEEQASFNTIKRRVEQSRIDARSTPHTDDSRYRPACEHHLSALNDVIGELELLENGTHGELSIEIAAYLVERVQERDRLKNNLSSATH